MGCLGLLSVRPPLCSNLALSAYCHFPFPQVALFDSPKNSVSTTCTRLRQKGRTTRLAGTKSDVCELGSVRLNSTLLPLGYTDESLLPFRLL